VIERVRAFLPTAAGRLTLGLTFVGAVIVGLAPDTGRSVDIEKLVACVVAGLAWLWSELADVGRVSDHDRALFQSITATLNQNALSFLKDHDFSYNLNVAHTAPVNAIAEWHGPQYQFNDRAIQKRWELLWSKLRDLSNLYGSTLVNTDNIQILTAWHLGFTRHNQPPQAHAEVKALNEAAHDVYRTFDKFVLFSRRRLAL
jgi:hypothetical protein